MVVNRGLATVLDKGDKRPEHPKYLSDMDGQIIVPGMIDAHLHADAVVIVIF